MKELHVLIDDLRDFDADITCRTVDHALQVLQNEAVTHLYLDNDLGYDQPMECIHILQWAVKNEVVPDNVCLVTANPVAKRRMEDILQHDLNYQKEKNWWKKVT